MKLRKKGGAGLAYQQFWPIFIKMARPLKLELVAVARLFHVTSRGDRRKDVYLYDEDRETIPLPITRPIRLSERRDGASLLYGRLHHEGDCWSLCFVEFHDGGVRVQQHDPSWPYPPPCGLKVFLLQGMSMHPLQSPANKYTVPGNPGL